MKKILGERQSLPRTVGWIIRVGRRRKNVDSLGKFERHYQNRDLDTGLTINTE